MKIKNLAIFLIFLCLSLLVLGCNQKNQKKITIATAANMQFAMEELITAFTEQTGIECDNIIGSSGKLTAQIREGAPFDIFVSADMKYPNEIYKNGLATGPPEIYAYGTLVLWTMDDSMSPSLKILADSKINHIAVANPKTAPYGVAALEVLKQYDLFPRLQDKLVYGESIAQTNQFIISRSAEIGFTAKSAVLSPQMSGKGKWVELQDSLYSRIDQGVVRIKHSAVENNNAIRFYNFLFSKDAKKILKNFGYLVDEL